MGFRQPGVHGIQASGFPRRPWAPRAPRALEYRTSFPCTYAHMDVVRIVKHAHTEHAVSGDREKVAEGISHEPVQDRAP